ncbi:MAG: prolyl-tRNA synthetase, prolyl-tRNA synthetase [Candidatus Gottesmanbacteria bacterium GW2011_GWA2_43_14]|uniref:Proline--tRNA ligase n=1 Tax=Candidatus Gottesmanbacteria bacterium GW2011_GWA2_43_14 TaxID=1618443 RepID=A0A0G1DJ48_9BACT|nr:MAG: prolyl-tRNA synthetase, prolyl-tRNA synthetase [Candidatus Gottesmanbacteria bacterium GW2011_GWA2_43_14]
MAKFEKKELKKKSGNFSDWYTDVILKSEMADYAPVKGCMVIRPYGYAIWENIQAYMDRLIKEKGVDNAYFPLLIPEKFLNLEKEHVEGFSPHLAVVTIAGGEKLSEKLIVRPTSETVMYQMYKEWFHSWRDLPVLINQWNNIIRWEKRTYLFLRTSEFLWQEGHCAHATHSESNDFILWALEMYAKTYRDLLGMHGITGIKSETEKFAGADKTYSVELLMPDGKALQGGTSHDLGQNFAKALDWTVLDKEGKKLNPWQNSWGFSTRSIGGLVMVNGDDNGLSLPPNVAPYQAVILPISAEDKSLDIYVQKLKDQLLKSGVRVAVDNDTNSSVGRRFNFWEVKGVPARLEIGKREMENKKVTIARRDNFEKETVDIDQITAHLQIILKEMQEQALARHRKFTQDNTHMTDDYSQFKKIMSEKRGFIRSLWCESKECEAKIKAETKATTRVLPLDAPEEKGKCIYCQKEAFHRWYFAQAY